MSGQVHRDSKDFVPSPEPDPDVPKAGDLIKAKDVQMILQAVVERGEKFPEEPVAMSLILVMQGIGDRFTPVECVNKEWKGLLKDVPKAEGTPKCPNGHELQKGKGLTLAWVERE